MTFTLYCIGVFLSILGVGLSSYFLGRNSMRRELFGPVDELKATYRASEAALKHLRDTWLAEHEQGLEEKNCSHCAGEFESVRKDALYCSNACRQAAYRARIAEGESSTEHGTERSDGGTIEEIIVKTHE